MSDAALLIENLNNLLTVGPSPQYPEGETLAEAIDCHLRKLVVNTEKMADALHELAMQGCEARP